LVPSTGRGGSGPTHLYPEVSVTPAQKICQGCGKAYFFRQAWMHDGCVVVNAPEEVVVNARSKDRHRKTPERLEYVRQKMREYRARRKVTPA
jgi:hypothetical protein